MSKRRTVANSSMRPPLLDRDVVMGPPPVPASTSSPPSAAQSKQKDPQELAEKYRRLKRKYLDLEEKHRETSSELHRSGERNVKMREERDGLIERIIELESLPGNKTNGASSASPVPIPASGAYPRSLLSTRARNSFIANLRQAASEEDPDDDIDPLLTSRHVGPLARKRAEEEKKERMEEEAKEVKRAARRGRGSHTHPSQKGKEVAGASAGQPLMTFNPSSGQPHLGQPVNVSPIVLSSSTGTRLRIKPPAPPQPDPSQSSNVVPSSSHTQQVPSTLPHSQSHSVSLARSESPLSPPMSTYDEPSPHSTGGSVNVPNTYLRNGNGVGAGTSSTNGDSPMGAGSDGVNPDSAASPHLISLSAHPHSVAGSPGNVSSRSASDVQRLAKPKRLKAHTVTSKSFSIPMVPRNEMNKPLLPLNVGIMTVINLGEVCMRQHFHTERYIFPVGYEVTRRYLSTVDPSAEVVYHCTILDGGDGPKFQIVPSDVPDRPVIAGTATGAWSNIVKQANHIRNRQHSNSVSGPDFFGLGQNTIKHLIQELPGADRLRDYVWQTFVEGGPLGGRHAAVIPALPEEYDASVPIGTYYLPDREKDRERERRGSRDEKLGSPQYQQMNHLSPPPPQSLQPGVTQIVLPPPTSSETLNIQEYQPPGLQKDEKRNTRGSTRGASPSPASARPHRQASRSPSTRSSIDHYPPPHAHHTRSSSRLNRQDPSSSGNQHSPYVENGNATSASPPPVPPTFASIMNAYPAPSASPRPSSSETVSGADGNASE